MFPVHFISLKWLRWFLNNLAQILSIMSWCVECMIGKGQVKVTVWGQTYFVSALYILNGWMVLKSLGTSQHNEPTCRTRVSARSFKFTVQGQTYTDCVSFLLWPYFLCLFCLIAEKVWNYFPQTFFLHFILKLSYYSRLNESKIIMEGDICFFVQKQPSSCNSKWIKLNQHERSKHQK